MTFPHFKRIEPHFSLAERISERLSGGLGIVLGALGVAMSVPLILFYAEVLVP